jgi:hypothetical protein
MATILQLRRGTTTQHNTFTGAVGEVTVDTTKDTVVVHDGSTAGGFPLATEAYVTSAIQTKDNSDEITEGSTNLYFTTTRARDAFSASTGISITSGAISSTITQYTDALARGSLSFIAGSGAYNSTTGAITIPTNTSQLTNGANFITLASLSASTGISYNNTTGAISSTITQYTDALARASVSVTDSGGDGSLAYNSTTGVITYTGPSATEVRAHFSAGTGITLSDGAIATTITQYTDALARAAISVTDSGGDGSLSYNSTNGVITYTGPSAADVRAHFSAGTGVTITDGAVAIGQAVGTGSNVTFNDLTVSGNLTVSGTTTTINTETINLADNIITLNSNEAGTPSQNAGIEVERGSSTNVAFQWNETTDVWEYTVDGTNYIPVVGTTATQTLTNKTLTSPTLTTPALGVATATSVNKVTLTAPATGSTLTIADGKTLTASNTLTFTGTDASSVAFGAGGTVLYNGGALGTPSSATLTNATGLPVSGITASTSSALGVGSIELGHATDTTIARSSAGVISVEGVIVPTVSSTNTLTNKTLTFPTIDNIKKGYTSTATAAGTTTLTATSNNYQRFTGATTQTIVLPVTSTLAAGVSYSIENASTGNLTVNSSGGNLVITVIPGVTVQCMCIGTALTTSADWDAEYIEFASITGTGSAVLSTSPTLVTPTLGVATATSVNKVTITAPATGSTLTIANGKTLTASNTLTFTGTDSSSVAFGAGGTVLYSGGALGTPSSGTLTNATGLPVSGITASTSTALGVGSVELGHATDTTLSRSSAGVLAVEGVVVPTVSSTNTLTNKTISGASNTLSNIANSSLTNSAITLAGTSVALGGSFTATNMLDAIKTVDGAGSGLDADLLDGNSSAHYRINVYNAAGTLLN